MKIGCDVDGVLADFNSAFIARVIAVTGRDLFPPRPFEITTWNYPESYGYTRQEVSDVWDGIKRDRGFWFNLGEYPETRSALGYLIHRWLLYGNDLYFITARPGLLAKHQTECWLRDRIAPFLPSVEFHPTVLITSHKGLAARTLELDAYIDDRFENALDVAQTSTHSFLLTRPWNTHGYESLDRTAITRVDTVDGFLGPGAGTRVGTSCQSEPRQAA